MEYINEFVVNEAVIHILDNNSDKPILNEYTLDLNNEEIYNFLNKHVDRCLKDEELRYGFFNSERNIIKDLSQEFLKQQISLLEVSKEAARQMFLLMKSKGNISSCDLIVLSISTEYGPFLGIMKMDYIKNYMHNVEVIDNKIGIDIIPQYSGLPSGGQRIQKCAFIKLIDEDNSFDLMLIDKQSRRKDNEEYGSNYFVTNYLGCNITQNERDMTKKFLESTEKWTRVNLKENAEAQEKVRSNIKRKLKERETLDVEKVAEDLFQDKPPVKEDFINYLKQEGSVNKVIVDKQWIEKKFKRIRLKIDKDIDIYINADTYNDDSRFEIKRNGDGTINMIIKHVSNYIEK